MFQDVVYWSPYIFPLYPVRALFGPTSYRSQYFRLPKVIWRAFSSMVVINSKDHHYTLCPIMKRSRFTVQIATSSIRKRPCLQIK